MMEDTFNTPKDRYRVSMEALPSVLRQTLYTINITYGDTVFPKTAGFNVVNWAQGQCGLINIFNHINTSRIDDDKFYEQLIPWILDRLDLYARPGGLITFCAYAEGVDGRQNHGLSAWMIKQENCKPVHHYRNQAHAPFSHMVMYAWHTNTKGLPDEWGTTITPIKLPQQQG